MDVSWFQQFLRSWEAGDIDAVVATVTDDVVFEDVALGHRSAGRDGFRVFAERVASGGGGVRFDVTGGFETDDGRYAIEWVMQPPGVRGVSIGRRVDGRIREHRDYWNRP